MLARSSVAIAFTAALVVLPAITSAQSLITGPSEDDWYSRQRAEEQASHAASEARDRAWHDRLDRDAQSIMDEGLARNRGYNDAVSDYRTNGPNSFIGR